MRRFRVEWITAQRRVSRRSNANRPPNFLVDIGCSHLQSFPNHRRRAHSSTGDHLFQRTPFQNGPCKSVCFVRCKTLFLLLDIELSSDRILLCISCSGQQIEILQMEKDLAEAMLNVKMVSASLAPTCASPLAPPPLAPRSVSILLLFSRFATCFGCRIRNSKKTLRKLWPLWMLL